MKKPIKFYIATCVARLSRIALRTLGRNASHLPGVLAVRILPNYLSYLEMPNRVVVVTGTNGKTTTVNMILSFLKEQNQEVVTNQLGSNILGGIISSLLTSTSFFGKNKKDLGVFEVDERASNLILPYLKPDIVVVTNLFRDSYRRNAHVGFIVDILETSIPKESTLILNADDLLVQNLRTENNRKLFSVAPQEGEEQVLDSIIQDVVYCPRCNHELTFDFKRYHHIGFAHCENCGYKNAEADCIVTSTGDTVRIEENGESYDYSAVGANITDTYNMVAAITALREMGYSQDTIRSGFNEMHIVGSRFHERMVGNHRLLTILSKDQNPVANSRVFDFIRKQKSWNSVSIVMMTEVSDYSGMPDVVENVAWLYDANFEYLNQDFINQIIIVGYRNEDFRARLLLAGFPDDKIVCLTKVDDLLSHVNYDSETYVLLHGTKNIDSTAKISNELASKLMEESV